jgi:hypothetical protein
MVGFRTVPAVVQVNGVLLHSLSSIGFNSQSGGSYGEIIGTNLIRNHDHILTPQITVIQPADAMKPKQSVNVIKNSCEL